ncbi:MAG: AraC family transcriptional regulator, partial [Acidobacteriota bacterium]
RSANIQLFSKYMQAYITELHRSSIGRIIDFHCCWTERGPSQLEATPAFTISFIRKGGFTYQVGRQQYDLHSGMVLVEGLGSEFTVTHFDAIQDECTIIEFSEEFLTRAKNEITGSNFDQYHWFEFTSAHNFSLLPATPKLFYLQMAILKVARQAEAGFQLQLDELLAALLWEIGCMQNGETQPLPMISFDRKETARYLAAVDRAKNFIAANYQEELLLAEIAQHSYISPFHFSRIFKQFTAYSPHQYLIAVRLKHAEILLTHTSQSITEVCFSSGFNHLEHFIAAFHRCYGISPAKFRKNLHSGSRLMKSKISKVFPSL